MTPAIFQCGQTIDSYRGNYSPVTAVASAVRFEGADEDQKNVVRVYSDGKTAATADKVRKPPSGLDE